MEALSKSLQPFKEIVGQTASIVTIGQFFSGAFVCKDIYKKKSTQGIPATPFIGGIVIGSLMLKHGILLNDAAMLQVNVAAIFLNIIYTVFYYIFSPNKYEDVLKPLGVGSVIVATFLGYAELEDPNNLEYRYGLIVTVLMLLLLGSPLLDVKEIIAKKRCFIYSISSYFYGNNCNFPLVTLWNNLIKQLYDHSKFNWFCAVFSSTDTNNIISWERRSEYKKEKRHKKILAWKYFLIMAYSRGYRIALMGIKESQKEVQVEDKKKTPKAVDVLYSSPLEISEIKFKNLMELCEERVIPQRFWNECKSFVAKADVPDTLAETDDEDEINNNEDY
ncbi:hypothetical protein NQ314_015349 [Rhamnusium bicolor]|uniref:Sugar transporter SWEET1 n=1 Tax=Rhamnusium bicolor TaxID=1586634 RepID=A0AAV8WZI3_9CUCU|nr:hypothetical protein NQ314_015349 [Rhamnusium bicolor]